MIKRLILSFLLTTAICFAQDSPPPTKNIIRFPDRDYIEDVPVRIDEHGMPTRLTNRVLFIHDCSGSMGENDLTNAINFVRGVMKQPLDEFEIGIIAFDENTYRWPGIPEPKQTPPVPPNWAALPSATAVDKVTQWLRTRDDEGSTKLVPALQLALQENRDKLSIVVISDGDFYTESTREIVAAIQKGQKWRLDNGLNKAPIMAIGVTSVSNDKLAKIGKIGGLGYYHPLEEEEEE